MTSSDTALRAVTREYVPAGRDEIQLETSGYSSGLYFVPHLVGPSTQTHRLSVVQ